MKKVVKIKNNLEEILKKRNIKKSDFANAIGTTNSTISNFISQERSTYNISLVEKMLSELGIEMRELFSTVKMYEFDDYEPGKFYKYEGKEDYYFSYSNIPNSLLFHLLIVKDNIVVEFKATMLKNFFIVNSEPFMEDAEFLKTLVEYTEKNGKSEVSVYESKEEALETINMLYL